MDLQKFPKSIIDQKKAQNSRYSNYKVSFEISSEKINKESSYAFKESGTERGHLRRLLLKEIPPNVLTDGKILDYGCGIGDLSIFLVNNGANNVYGIDLSDVAININKKRLDANNLFDKIKPIVGSITDMPFSDNTFDVVVGQAILHHIYDLKDAAAELDRVLKPYGIAIFTESLSDSLLMKIPRIYTKWRFTKRYPNAGEHYMNRKIIYHFGHLFKTTTINEHSILYMIKRFFRNHFNKNGMYKPWVRWILHKAYIFDSMIVREFPFVKRFCGEAIIVYKK